MAGGGTVSRVLRARHGLEAYGFTLIGSLLREVVCLAYLLLEVSWRKQPGQGALAFGLKTALTLGLAGLGLATFVLPWQRISVDHLLYIGGFGLLMLVVGSRVLFGHSGQLGMFSQRSWTARLIVGLAVLAALTRAVPARVPAVTVSHHHYVAIIWAVLVIPHSLFLQIPGIRSGSTAPGSSPLPNGQMVQIIRQRLSQPTGRFRRRSLNLIVRPFRRLP